MRVQLSHGTYQIDWEHAHFNPPVDLSGVLVQGSTTCIVGPLEEGAGVVSAVAYCSVRDVFEKERGRKVSMTRALREAGLSKADRAKVWDAYRRRT